MDSVEQWVDLGTGDHRHPVPWLRDLRPEGIRRLGQLRSGGTENEEEVGVGGGERVRPSAPVQLRLGFPPQGAAAGCVDEQDRRPGEGPAPDNPMWPHRDGLKWPHLLGLVLLRCDAV